MKIYKKFQAEECLKGRSMVEMLGVLAIIGVLSAGALKGYSDAMFRHKVNQTIDIFNGVLQKFTELEQKDSWTGNGNIMGADDLIKYGFLEDCQKAYVDVNSSYGCKLPIGTLTPELFYENSYFSGAFIMEFTDSKSCTAFLSAKWENAIPVEWFNPEGQLRVDGEMLYAWDNTVDMYASDYAEACETCNAGYCSFWIIIREY